MKSMAAELNMFQAQCSEYKYEIERLTTELTDLKKQYYETKRRESLTREIRARKTLQIKDVLNKENFNTLNSSLPKKCARYYALHATFNPQLSLTSPFPSPHWWGIPYPTSVNFQC